MKFNNHGTYISPNSVVEIARMPAVLLRETNCRTHKPSTNKIRKLDSKSFALPGNSRFTGSTPVSAKNVPAIKSSPPRIPHGLKQTKSRFATRS